MRRQSLHYQHAPRRGLRRIGILVVVLVVIVVAIGIVQVLRPVAPAQATATAPAQVTVATGGYRMPAEHAESALAVEGIGMIYASPAEPQISIASVTKLMSVLVILADHPLSVGSPGPSITITPADVTSYLQAKAAGDSVVAVQAGEQLSEYQALEAVLVPSADNVVRLLAIWDAGSTSAFVAKMNADARRLGLTHTHYAGPSGVNPGSVSTAADQVRLAEVALANPVIAGIVAMPQTTLPVVGTAYNVDADLGHDGIVGVKTGWVPAGGASFVFAADTTVDGHHETVVGAIVGEQGGTPVPTVLSDAEQVAHAAISGFLEEHSVRSGTRVAELKAAYGQPVSVVTAGSGTLVVWRGAHIVQKVVLARRLGTTIHAGERVGTLVDSLGAEHVDVPIVAAGNISSPPLSWKLFHF